ncbi:MAG: carbohydrate-binding domain-containing protein, partial [Verrucomicrobiota bacterium]
AMRTDFVKGGFNFNYIELRPAGTTPPPVDTTAPTAGLSATDLTVASGNPYTFTVTYSDDVAVDASTVDVTDVQVTDGNGNPVTVSSVSYDAPTGVATYSVSAPGGDWETSDNGTYTITQQANAVSDTSGNFADSGELGSFVVNIPTNPPVDTTAPTASLSATDLTLASGNPYTFTVTYGDDVAVDASTVDVTDVQVTDGNGNPVTVNSVSYDAPTGVATYSVTPPGGDWETSDNGTYTITQPANAVSDTSGNFAASGELGSFNVNISDTPPPSGDVIRIEAEDYLGGTNGVEYFDSTAGNSGGAYRNDDVDIEVTSDADGGFHIQSIAKDEFLTYTVDIPQAGEYDLVVRAATGRSKAREMQVTIGNTTVTVEVPPTGGFDSWQDIVIPGVLLDAGTQAMRTDFVKGAFDFNYIELRPAGPDVQSPLASLVTSSLEL